MRHSLRNRDSIQFENNGGHQFWIWLHSAAFDWKATRSIAETRYAIILKKREESTTCYTMYGKIALLRNGRYLHQIMKDWSQETEEESTGICILQAFFSGIAVATGQTRTQSQLWESQDHYTRRVLLLYDGVWLFLIWSILDYLV